MRAVIEREMRTRNESSAPFFAREAGRLAALARRMAERFDRGGRLMAFGTGHAVSDAQHIAVEFVHPVLVGKRALPALDLSAAYRDTIPALIRSDDILVALGSPAVDPSSAGVLREAMSRGALGIALPGDTGDYAIGPPSGDPFVHQELIEVLYHTLWETVHVFFERRPLHQEGGAAAFLYPFLAEESQPSDDVVPEAAASIRAKASFVERMRGEVAEAQGDAIVEAVLAIRRRVDAGGAVLCFGNGGSATDANDLALDLSASPKGYAAVPALSLSSEPATLTALANDIGSESLFARQVIAHARPGDVAVAISTSGGSANILGALREARSRGLLTIALVGYDGGDVLRRRLADHVIVVSTDQIPRVQEVQASIYHVMVDLLDFVRRGDD